MNNEKCPVNCSIRYITALTKEIVDASPYCAKCIYCKSGKVCAGLDLIQETTTQLANIINKNDIVLNHKKIRAIDTLNDNKESLIVCSIDFYYAILASVVTICVEGENCKYTADVPCDCLRVMSKTLRDFEDIMDLGIIPILTTKEK